MNTQKPKKQAPLAARIIGILILTTPLFLVGYCVHSCMNDDEEAVTKVEKQEPITRDSLIRQVTKNLKNFDKNWDHGPWDGNLKDYGDINLTLIPYYYWGTVITTADSLNLPELKALANHARKRLREIQIRDFPRMRRSLAKSMDSKLFRENVRVSVRGSKSDILRFNGYAFANNANIEDSQNMIQNFVKTIRFKRVEYQWYDGGEYTYYTITSRKDSDFLKINSNDFVE